jgi:hypothetical protein
MVRSAAGDHRGRASPRTDWPIPLPRLHDDLDFNIKDHHKYQQEGEMVKQHLYLRLISRRDHPAGFFVLTAIGEESVYAGGLRARL